MKKLNKHSVYHIFAIIGDAVDGDDRLVYVSKTKQKDLSRVLQYHKRKHYYARPVFEEGTNVRIYCLDTIFGTQADAYRLVLCYIRYFIEHNWDVVSHEKPYEDSLDLHNFTQKMYDRIATKPISELLSYTPISLKPTEPNTKIIDAKMPLTSRLSIRVTEEEHKSFLAFCEDQNLTQRDAILTLFRQNELLENCVERRIQEQANLIDWQRRYIQRLDERIRNGPRGANADKKLIEAFLNCKKGIYRYIKSVIDINDFSETLPCVSWKQFIRICPDHESFVFPMGTDPFFFQLQYMCYGKGSKPCIFLYGQDFYTKQKIRLRFYDKREYIGPRPNRSPYFCENTKFLVICKQDEHEAADMLLCLPLPPRIDTASESLVDFSAGSIDYIIKDATERSF